MIYRIGIMLTGCLSVLLAACATGNNWGSSESIGSLRGKTIKVEEERIEGSLEKAIASYKQFLESTPETEMTPEALRRIADLKIQVIERGSSLDKALPAAPKAGASAVVPPLGRQKKEPAKPKAKPIPGESLESLEKRTSQITEIESDKSKAPANLPGSDTMRQQVLADDANSKEAIRIYKELLKKYPDYQHNDKVLYQLARAYGVRGEQDAELEVLDRIVKQYPYTNLIDEVQFRRGEVFFVRKAYSAAEKAYQAVLNTGKGSLFYDQSLYKHGWSLFKQSRYEEGLNSFISLIDNKAAGGRAAIEGFDEIERQRLHDTLRVVSFSFTYIGGPSAMADYFKKRGKRPYEDMLFSDLGEHYLDKRRYADAAEAFAKFVERNPLHEMAPVFQMRVIDVYEKGGFPKLVIDGKREFARIYDINGIYWKSHDINKSPEVLAFIKQNLIDLANHFHALSQKNPKDGEHKEAIKWYRTFLASFPADPLAAGLNFMLAEVLYDSKDFLASAVEYEKTAYQYPKHEKAPEAGYAAILAYREHIKVVPDQEKAGILRRTITSSLRFADTYPASPNVAPVLTQASVDLFERNDFKSARDVARRLLAEHPKADAKLRRSAWTVTAHSSFDLNDYAEAEKGYVQALDLISGNASDRAPLVDRLAAAIYKQGEQSQQGGELRVAVGHFLRIGQLAPQSPIRSTAEYDAAAALIKLKDWGQASAVLESFRKRYQGHERQGEVTKMLAVSYEEGGEWALAAAEFERIEKSTTDIALRREANIRSAELYEKANQLGLAIVVYARFIKQFPDPIGQAVEAMQHLADLYKKTSDEKRYLSMLHDIVRVDDTSGANRSDRTRYLAAMAKLELSEPVIEEYRKIRLTLPLKKSLEKKKASMQHALKIYGDLLDYGVGDVTAASTYHIADIYYDLTRAILESDRPKKLSALELEQYNILLEEQAFPFEEKAIGIHKKNLELLEKGVYNDWIAKSIAQLGKLVPVRYAKVEQSEAYASAGY